MSTRQSMRVGFVGPFYPVPAAIEKDKKCEWQIIRSAELGCTALQVPDLPADPGALKGLRDRAASKNVELESGAGGVFGLVGPKARESRDGLLQSIAIAKTLGCKLIRTGYGHNNIVTSRFNKEIPLAQHLDILVQNLKVAAPIVADNGLILAIENHCDFTGKEMARVFEAVGSPVVGCALDTANGFTVYCDPNDDVQDLARYTMTTHLKDMLMVDFKTPGLIPMVPVGCAVGDGHVDIPATIAAFERDSPWAQGLHLIIELSWERIPEGQSRDEGRLDMFHKSIEYLKKLTS